ncbi:hypothetical protein EVAR_84039_1 [Eumeta japonica]|uniref:Uncharacterized protein n=1 Tax=Eumeta variegata TaxID=151549 RepID=A0A4C1X926_EUMVA|nr:hypothetical protein EVAR_84039_1 [Eumeta japonica]
MFNAPGRRNRKTKRGRMRGTITYARSIPVTDQRERQQRVASNIPTQEGERKKDTQRARERRRGFLASLMSTFITADNRRAGARRASRQIYLRSV